VDSEANDLWLEFGRSFNDAAMLNRRVGRGEWPGSNRTIPSESFTKTKLTQCQLPTRLKGPNCLKGSRRWTLAKLS
jgi:hypothetical protein